MTLGMTLLSQLYVSLYDIALAIVYVPCMTWLSLCLCCVACMPVALWVGVQEQHDHNLVMERTRIHKLLGTNMNLGQLSKSNVAAFVKCVRVLGVDIQELPPTCEVLDMLNEESLCKRLKQLLDKINSKKVCSLLLVCQASLSLSHTHTLSFSHSLCLSLSLTHTPPPMHMNTNPMLVSLLVCRLLSTCRLMHAIWRQL